jgi:hypothetical protein
MIIKGNNRNLGDPSTVPGNNGMRSDKSENREGGSDGSMGVGSVHSRINNMGNHVDIPEGKFEGTDSHTKCNEETSSIRRIGKKTETKLLHIMEVV